MIETVDIPVDPGSWDEALSCTDGPQIVVGGPGTGKTEFLGRRAAHLAAAGMRPSRIIAIGFARRGVVDLASRIRGAQGTGAARIEVTTFHALAARILDRWWTLREWAAPPTLLTGPEQVELVGGMLSEFPGSKLSPAFRDIVGTGTFAHEVTEFILRAREQLLDDASLRRLCDTRRDWQGMGEFAERYDAELRRLGCVDYGTLLAEAVQIATRLGAGSVDSRDPYLLVDEYEEATAAQATLLRLLAGSSRHVTVAADPDQAVFGFRGGDPGIVTTFPAAFTGDGGAPARRLTLTTSFRTPAPILEGAVRIASRPTVTADRTLPAPHNGRVEYREFADRGEEAGWIAGELHRAHLEQGIDYAAMAVFTRETRRLLPALARELSRRHVPYHGLEPSAFERPAARFLLDVVAATTGTDGPGEAGRAVRRVLHGPMFAASREEVRAVEHARWQLEDPSWSAALHKGDGRFRPLADLLAEEAWVSRLPATHGFWELWCRLDGVRSLATDPRRSAERTDWASLSAEIERWSERHPDGSLQDYCRLLAAEAFAARTPDRHAHRPGIALTTLHQAKGRNLDLVVIADAVEGTFPDLRSRDSLLGVRHLLPHVPRDLPGYRAFRLRQERRLAYTAMVRASRRVIWTAARGGPGSDAETRSRFFAGPVGPATGGRAGRRDPITPGEAEAVLRRLVCDPSAPAPDRYAALTVMAERRHPDFRDPFALADRPMSPGAGPDLPPPSSLSPSDAEAYLHCPRRYVLERRLGIGSGPSPHASFGMLIHKVLEEAEGNAAAVGAPHASKDDALAIFDGAFDPAAFGGPPFSDAWKRRGRSDLGRLYDDWPSDGTVASVEQPLELELGGVRWRGRADRIEETPRGALIVDYKTSRSTITKKDASISIQLGYYLLAGRESANAEGSMSAEMWFLSAATKRVAVRRFDVANLGLVREALAAAASGISRADWAPRPGPHCGRCPQRALCPAVGAVDRLGS